MIYCIVIIISTKRIFDYLAPATQKVLRELQCKTVTKSAEESEALKKIEKSSSEKPKKGRRKSESSDSVESAEQPPPPPKRRRGPRTRVIEQENVPESVLSDLLDTVVSNPEIDFLVVSMLSEYEKIAKGIRFYPYT